jgi:type II secretory pathway component PulF
MVRTPFVGGAYRMVVMARSLDALAMLNAEGVPAERCYSLAAKVAGHWEYTDYYNAVYRHIHAGRKPYTAFLAERYRIGDEGRDVAARMEAAGVTGEVSSSLQVAANAMSEIANARLDVLPKLIGPAVTVVVTGVVGILASAVFLPTFSLLLNALKSGVSKH